MNDRGLGESNEQSGIVAMHCSGKILSRSSWYRSPSSVQYGPPTQPDVPGNIGSQEYMVCAGASHAPEHEKDESSSALKATKRIDE